MQVTVRRVRRVTRLAALLLFACLVSVSLSTASASVYAQDVVELEEPPVSLLTSFDHYWRRYLAAVEAGNSEDASRLLDEIRRLRVERNTFELHNVAMAFVHRGYGYLGAGDAEQARASFETAHQLSPTLPTAYWGLASAAASEGGVGWITAILHRLRAKWISLSSARNLPFALSNLGAILFAAGIGVMFIVGLLMLYRYGVLLHHDLEERLGGQLGSTTILAASVAVALLPVLITLGAGWLAPYWLAITFGYQTIKERAVTIVAMLGLVLAAPFAEIYVSWVRTTANPLYQAALSSVTGTVDLSDVEVVRRAARDNPQDRDLQFLLATLLKNLGDYELAAGEYRRILDVFPEDLDSRVNLGNIYFAQRDWEGALVQYSQVLAADPGQAMAHYNKSLAHAENFQFDERGDSRARAEGIDAAVVALHERRTGDYRVVADAKFDESELLRKFLGLREGFHDRPVGSFFDSRVWNGWGVRLASIPLLLSVLIALLEVVFRERRLTKRCSKCGSAFCGRCQIGTGRKGLCTQCYHLFIMKDGVSAAARQEKMQQVHSAKRIRSILFRVLSLVTPGAGHVLDGATVVGVFMLFIWVLCAAWALSSGFPYVLPDAVFGAGTSPPYLALATMGVVLVSANVVFAPAGVRG
jgi:tetratricopeptide (TPR) repeat protein